MRYVRTVIWPREGGLHPVDEAFAAAPDLTRELLHNISLLDDGTAITLVELSGDPERAHEIAQTSEEVLDYQLSEGDGRILLYCYFVPTERIVSLLSLFREYELILDMPLEYTSTGRSSRRSPTRSAAPSNRSPTTPPRRSGCSGC